MNNLFQREEPCKRRDLVELKINAILRFQIKPDKLMNEDSQKERDTVDQATTSMEEETDTAENLQQESPSDPTEDTWRECAKRC